MFEANAGFDITIKCSELCVWFCRTGSAVGFLLHYHHKYESDELFFDITIAPL